MKISCPHCGQHYEIEDSDVGAEVACEQCGSTFTASGAEAPAPALTAPPAVVSCRYCGGEIARGVKKCRHCGEWLDADSMPRNEVVFIVLLLMLGMLGGHNFYTGATRRGIVKVSLMLGIPLLYAVLALLDWMLQMGWLFVVMPLLISLWAISAVVIMIYNFFEMIYCHEECLKCRDEKR